MITKTIPEDIVLELQKADIEQQSRKDIITNILRLNLDISNERFEQYHQDFEKKLQVFNNCKAKFENEWVKPLKEGSVRWSVSYDTCILEVD